MYKNNDGKFDDFCPSKADDFYFLNKKNKKVIDFSCNFGQISLFNFSSSIVEKTIHKGSKIYLEGTLKNRKYTSQDGVERNISEVIIQGFDHTIKLLDHKPRDFNNNNGSDNNVDNNVDDNEEEEESSTDDDSIPF